MSRDCYYAVPPDWKAGEFGETSNTLAASRGDGRRPLVGNDAVAPRDHDLRAIAQPKQLHADTNDRYWVEITETGRPDVARRRDPGVIEWRV